MVARSTTLRGALNSGDTEVLRALLPDERVQMSSEEAIKEIAESEWQFCQDRIHFLQPEVSYAERRLKDA
jgi:hypothetical protein